MSHPSPPPFRPLLEPLEGRLAPSTDFLGSGEFAAERAGLQDYYVMQPEVEPVIDEHGTGAIDLSDPDRSGVGIPDLVPDRIAEPMDPLGSKVTDVVFAEDEQLTLLEPTDHADAVDAVFELRE